MTDLPFARSEAILQGRAEPEKGVRLAGSVADLAVDAQSFLVVMCGLLMAVSEGSDLAEFAEGVRLAESVADLAVDAQSFLFMLRGLLIAALYEQVTGSPTGQDSVVGTERLRSWLEACAYRWLVVFDNAADAGVLDGLVPRAGTGQVLITSRRSEWPRLGATVRRLGVLGSDDAVSLLRTITGLDDECRSPGGRRAQGG